METINVARDFSRVPMGQTPDAGPANATDFREKFLVPVIRDGRRARVELDGTIGYPAAFLREAFGGLVVKNGFTPERIRKALTLVAEGGGTRIFRRLIEKYIDEAARDTERRPT